VEEPVSTRQENAEHALDSEHTRGKKEPFLARVKRGSPFFNPPRTLAPATRRQPGFPW
jgi:hypothetical protein